MREIKFRGKRLDTGEWGYGNLLQRDGKVYVGERGVDPATVGQYTGERDKNNVEVYEDDWVVFKPHQMPFQVKYDGGAFWAQEPLNKWRQLLSEAVAQPDCQVMSNIHDMPEYFGESPELLKAQA